MEINYNLTINVDMVFFPKCLSLENSILELIIKGRRMQEKFPFDNCFKINIMSSLDIIIYFKLHITEHNCSARAKLALPPNQKGIYKIIEKAVEFDLLGKFNSKTYKILMKFTYHPDNKDVLNKSVNRCRLLQIDKKQDYLQPITMRFQNNIYEIDRFSYLIKGILDKLNRANELKAFISKIKVTISNSKKENDRILTSITNKNSSLEKIVKSIKDELKAKKKILRKAFKRLSSRQNMMYYYNSIIADEGSDSNTLVDNDVIHLNLID